MNKRSRSPVAVYPCENETVTIPGPDCEAALRVRIVGVPDNDVRLEQLAYSPALGWYVQKSFCIPGCMLGDLILQLRKADCLIPRRPGRKQGGRSQSNAPLPFPGPDLASKIA